MKLPKGMAKLTKERFVTEMVKFQEEKEIPFKFASRTYKEWADTGSNKSAKITYRW